MIGFKAATRLAACALAAVGAVACSPRDRGPDAPSREANIYAGTGADHMSAAVAGELARVYVPNVGSGDVYVIDPSSMQVTNRFPALGNPQHVVPSWDLKTLWVTGSAKGGTNSGGLTAIDPTTGKSLGSIPGRGCIQHVLHARRALGPGCRGDQHAASNIAIHRRCAAA